MFDEAVWVFGFGADSNELISQTEPFASTSWGEEGESKFHVDCIPQNLIILRGAGFGLRKPIKRKIWAINLPFLRGCTILLHTKPLT